MVYSALIFGFQFAGILGAILIAPNFVLNFDRLILNYIQSFQSPFLTPVFLALTFLGDKFFVVAAVLSAAAVLFYFKFKREALFIIAATAGSQILSFLFKNLIARPRPFINTLAEADGFSFPSGHSIAAVAFYGALAWVLLEFFDKKWKKSLTIGVVSVFIMLIGLSRIYLGVHWPSDVLGSFALGAAWLIFVIFVFKKNKPTF
ncbi:MAG: phosphatase PAP2 family protein [Patescibacteria group bacterium]